MPFGLSRVWLDHRSVHTARIAIEYATFFLQTKTSMLQIAAAGGSPPGRAGYRPLTAWHERAPGGADA
jgi:hypothetical protein